MDQEIELETLASRAERDLDLVFDCEMYYPKYRALRERVLRAYFRKDASGDCGFRRTALGCHLNRQVPLRNERPVVTDPYRSQRGGSKNIDLTHAVLILEEGREAYRRRTAGNKQVSHLCGNKICLARWRLWGRTAYKQRAKKQVSRLCGNSVCFNAEHLNIEVIITN